MELLHDRYELREVIGRGGTAEVRRAWDRLLHREVAVKVLLSAGELEEADAARHRFDAEARLLARLDHPAIVRVLDVGLGSAAPGPVSGSGSGTGTPPTRPYFVLELVEGGTLAGLLASEGPDGPPLEPRLVAVLGAQLAGALAHAHERGVVHRDVKPGNVLLTTDGHAKLADFGIARLVGDGPGVTRTGHTVGTVAYLAPEQVRGGRVGAAADVYALGLLLLEALTGVRAFPGTSAESAFARLHHGPTIPLSLPPGWPRLLAAMTASEPGDRPPASAAAEQLDRLAHAAGVRGASLVDAGLPATRDVTIGTGAGVRAAMGPGTGAAVGAAVDQEPQTRSVRLAGPGGLAGWRPSRRHRTRLLAAAAVLVVGTAASVTLGDGLLGPDAAVSDDRVPPASLAATRVQPASVLSRTATYGSGREETNATTSTATTEATSGTRAADGPRQPEQESAEAGKKPGAGKHAGVHPGKGGPKGKAGAKGPKPGGKAKGHGPGGKKGKGHGPGGKKGKGRG